MPRGEARVELAMLRMQMRVVEAEIATIRRESRRYRQMDFGLEIKEMQLTALQDQRDACLGRIRELRQQLQLQAPRRNHPLAWLLLPVALGQRLQRAPATRPALPAPQPPAYAVPVFGHERLAVGAGR